MKPMKPKRCLSMRRAVLAAGFAAALFGTCVPAAPLPGNGGRLPAISGDETPRNGAEGTGDGQGISPQNDDENYCESKD